MSTQQPEALRLAAYLRESFGILVPTSQAAAELERQHACIEALEASERQHLQELRSYRITVENREARIAELEAEIERLRKLHKDAYQRGCQAGSMGLREVYDAVQEVKRQDAWGNAQLTEALIAAEARIAELEAQLIAEAARTAEQKLRADQLEQQHDMQAKMHAQAAEQLAAAQQSVEVTDDMALAFHQALTDGALGADDLDDIKTGLRAALSHVQPLQKTVAAQQGVQPSDKDLRDKVARALGCGTGTNYAWSYLLKQIESLVECEEEFIAMKQSTHPSTQGLDAKAYTMSIERAGGVASVKIPVLKFSNARLQEQLLGAEALGLIQMVDRHLAAQAKHGGAA